MKELKAIQADVTWSFGTQTVEICQGYLWYKQMIFQNYLWYERSKTVVHIGIPMWIYSSV